MSQLLSFAGFRSGLIVGDERFDSHDGAGSDFVVDCFDVSQGRRDSLLDSLPGDVVGSR